MSFTAQVKEELARVFPMCKNCEKAELAALVRIVGTLTISAKAPRIEAATETACVARNMIQLLHGVYGLKTELTVRRSKLHKAHNFLITVPAQRGLKAALQDLGLLAMPDGEHQNSSQQKQGPQAAGAQTDKSLLARAQAGNPQPALAQVKTPQETQAGNPQASNPQASNPQAGQAGNLQTSQPFSAEMLKNKCCAGAFLRGAFLAGGYLADPKGNFHFELVCQSEELAEMFIQIMNEHNIPAKKTRRYNMQVVYLKSAEPIISFLAFAGATNSAAVLENARMVKSVRNDTNRKVNAEIANQKKASAASLKQIMQIKHIIQTKGLDSIPENLQEVALLRLRYPDASIKELGQFADPPLSKNAVYHRLSRIQNLAEVI